MKLLVFLSCLTITLADFEFERIVVVKSNSNSNSNQHEINFNVINNILKQVIQNPEFDNNKVVINKYLDQGIKVLQHFLIDQQLDPLQLPDVEKEFKKKFSIVEVTGHLNLTNGTSIGIGTVERDGIATLTYEAGYLNIHLPLNFNILTFEYDFNAAISYYSESGTVDGQAEDVAINVDLTMDMKTSELILQEFEIRHAGQLTVKFHSDSYVQWLENYLSNLMISFFHDLITSIFEEKVRGTIQQVIEDYNKQIRN